MARCCPKTVQALALDAPFQGGTRVYYYRELPNERPVPFEETVLFQDEHLVVADKPHFLPVTPGGRYVQQSLLVRLQRKLDLPQLAPLHRIDRETAGLVLFAVNPAERGAYHALFSGRDMHKTYEAIAPATRQLGWPHTRRSRLEEHPTEFYRMVEADGRFGTQQRNTHRHAGAARSMGPLPTEPHQRQTAPVAGAHERPGPAHRGRPALPDRAARARRRAKTFPSRCGCWPKRIAFTDPITGMKRGVSRARLQARSWPSQC